MSSESLAALEAALRSIGHGPSVTHAAAAGVLRAHTLAGLSTDLAAATDGEIHGLAELVLHCLVDAFPESEQESGAGLERVARAVWSVAIQRRSLRVSSLAALEAAIAQAVAGRDISVQSRLARLVLDVGPFESMVQTRVQRLLQPLRVGAGLASEDSVGVAAVVWDGRARLETRARALWIGLG